MTNTQFPRFPDVQVELIGQDGNAFNLIGLTAKALRRAGHPFEANQFTSEAMEMGAYDELLQLIMRTVEVS